MTDNCSNSFSGLYVFKAFTVLKPTSKIVARNKNGDAIKLRLVVAKGWGLPSIQKSIQQDLKESPTKRLCKAEYYSNKYNTFLHFVTKLFRGCPWSLSPDIIQRLSPMSFPRLPEVALEFSQRLTLRFAFMVTSDGAMPGCLARLPCQVAMPGCSQCCS